jgi:hypothetical protein
VTAETRSPLASGGATPRPLLLILLAAVALLSPLAIRAAGGTAGAFMMFTQPMRFRLRVIAVGSDGRQSLLELARLGPHLGNDARRILLPAEDWQVGETQLALLATALRDIGELACKLEPNATRCDVVLELHSVEHRSHDGKRVRVSCGAPSR